MRPCPRGETDGGLTVSFTVSRNGANRPNCLRAVRAAPPEEVLVLRNGVCHQMPAILRSPGSIRS
jgi:hypothetical protein